jgi:hypothetical protein
MILKIIEQRIKIKMPKQIFIDEKTITTKTSTMKLSGENIITLLKRCKIIGENASADITFHVPGGGDYSNMKLDIDEENSIHVKSVEEIKK